MACYISAFSAISDLQEIRKKLCRDDAHQFQDESGEVDEELDWTWNDDDDAADQAVDETKIESPYLQQWLVAISPVGDVMVIADGINATFLTKKWDNNEEGDIKEKYFPCASEQLADTEDDSITCVICLPLASQKRSARDGPDWTAVIVGFASGFVKIYTENGILLLTQKFHEEAVTALKCRTFEHPRHYALAEQQEELVIVYKKAVVTIDGFSIYQTLRACRNQVAKATAYGNETFEAPPIAYKKWGFQDHEIVNDCESIGVSYSNLFDDMMIKSINRGYYIGSHSSTSSLFIATGHTPYLSFFYAVEEGAHTLVMEVAMAAANKIVSLLTGVFGRSHQSSSDRKPIPKIEPSTPLSSRFQLRDSTRLGRSICVSPGRRLSVVTDDFGRVILIDNKEGVALRFWKGYRDAQCGWIEVEEDSRLVEKQDSTEGVQPRIALFLVIYCPRWGTLEIWAMQQGPRVAVFSVSKNARLVYCGHGILGLSNVQSVIKGKAQTNPCFLIDSDGQVKTISVPFYFILSAKHSKRAHDLHLLSNLKSLLKDNEKDGEALIAEVFPVVLDIKTAAVCQQALDAIFSLKSNRLHLIKNTIEKLYDKLSIQDPSTLDFESKLFCVSVLQLRKVLELYEGLENLQGSNKESTLDNVEGEQALSAMLHLKCDEVEELLKRVDKYISVIVSQKCVHFGRNTAKLPPGKFLSCFQTQCYHLPKQITADSFSLNACLSDPVQISIDQLDSDTLNSLSYTFYHSAICGQINLAEFKAVLLQSGVEAEHLMVMLIEYWLQLGKHVGDWSVLRKFRDICSFLSELKDLTEVVAGYNDISPWWNVIRSTLVKSTNIPAAFTAALVCRGVAVHLASCYQAKVFHADAEENKTDKDKDTYSKSKEISSSGDRERESNFMDVSLSDWEGVDLDTEEWSLLVKQLEDVIVLNTLLNYKIPSFMSSECYTVSTKLEPITINSVIAKGRGAVSEVVAVWMTGLNIDRIMDLLFPSLACQASESVDIEVGQEAVTQGIQNKILELTGVFEEIRSHFPYSLSPDILLANCCWEFGANWNKSKDSVENLQNAVCCLKRISGLSLCRGLASFLWNTFMKQSFTSSAYLIEKVGKIPKERLCRNEVGMSNASLEKFVDCCVKVLDTLMKACDSRESLNVCQFRCEEPWQNNTGPFPLVDLIFVQKEPSYHLVCHHYKLALSMHIILKFGLKSSKPLSFYDAIGSRAFFKDLHLKISIPDYTPDATIVTNRSKFLQRAISAIVLSVPEPVFHVDGNSTVLLMSSTENMNLSFWIGRVMELASLWRTDTDGLYRHCICELYSGGLDYLAEEILPIVTDREMMASQLILIAGQRIYNAINDADTKYVKKLTVFPPTVTAWLTTLNQNPLRYQNPPLNLTATMITYIINAIPEESSLHKLAVSLVEPLQQLLSNDSESTQAEEDR